METVKALLKNTKSTNDLLTSSHNSAQCLSVKKQPESKMTNNSNLLSPSNLLQVPSIHSGSSSLANSSVSESSELSQVSDCEPFDSSNGKDSAKKLKKMQKSIRKQRKRNEKQLSELVQFLHVDPIPSKTSSSSLHSEKSDCDLNSSNSFNQSIRLNKSLIEYLDPDSCEPAQKLKINSSKSFTLNESIDNSNKKAALKSTKSNNDEAISTVPKFQIGDDTEDNEQDYAEANERTLTNNDTITVGGFRRIRRFGYDVADGCGFPLSLKREEEENDPTITLTRRRSWKQIIARADEYLHKQSIGHKKIALQQLYQVCPCPEVEFNSLSGMLPFRRWNSEYRLPLSSSMERVASTSKKQSQTACDWTFFHKATRRHSCEDLRHLSGCSLRNSYDMKQSSTISRQQSFGPMSDFSGCCSSEMSSERSNSCSLRSVSSSCSSISNVSTLIALDLNQLGKFQFNTMKLFFLTFCFFFI